MKTRIRELAVRLGRFRLPLLCVLAGFLLYALARLLAGRGTAAEDASCLKRGGYGKGRTEELYVSGLTDGELLLDIPVSGRRFSDSEIGEAFSRCMEEVIARMPGENASLQEVRSGLVLPERMGDYGFRLLWTSERPDLVSPSGEVRGDALEEAQEVRLHVLVTDGEREANYVVPVCVLPPLLTEEEGRVRRFLALVGEEDADAASEEGVRLPDSFEGRRLSYREPEKRDLSFLWMLGIVSAVLLVLRDRERVRTEENRRRKQMQIDYPEILSRLMVYIGAGMSVRAGWDCIARDYEAADSEPRYAYEELCRANNRLKTGAPEGRVYSDFGRACRSRQYMKLASLLEQSRKTGVSDLKAILALEVAEAWEERKNLARRSGEEASTKLLLPLMMMLGIVMVMIMVPAMTNF